MMIRPLFLLHYKTFKKLPHAQLDKDFQDQNVLIVHLAVKRVHRILHVHPACPQNFYYQKRLVHAQLVHTTVRQMIVILVVQNSTMIQKLKLA